MASLAQTLRALAAPGRGVPIAAVTAALAGAQLLYGPPKNVVVPVGMAAGFVALAPWSWRALLAGGWSLIGGALYAVGAIGVVSLFGIVVPAALGLGPTFLTDDGSLVVAVVLYLVGGWGLGRDIELEHDLAHVRLKAIRTHLDPHFLYNTLNAIAEWCAEDARIAEDAIARLAALLRVTLDALELRSWPLARELDVIRDLLELHRIRDISAFSAELEIDEPARSLSVPPLLMVALVENALKHGPRSGHRGAITLRVVRTRAGVRCELENPGAFAPAGRGRGLETVRSRLELGYGRRARFSIASAGADRTRAVLEVPAA
jgi:hypothetical protein